MFSSLEKQHIKEYIIIIIIIITDTIRLFVGRLMDGGYEYKIQSRERLKKAPFPWHRNCFI